MKRAIHKVFQPYSLGEELFKVDESDSRVSQAGQKITEEVSEGGKRTN